MKMTKQEASDLFDSLDVDKNGVVTQEELAMMNNHKQHMLELEKEKAEMQKFLSSVGLAKFATKLHDFGIERVSDLSDKELVTAQLLKEDIGMSDEEAGKLL